LREGFRFDSGLVSPQFVTDQKRMTAFHGESLMLITDTTVSNVRDLMPVLELAARDGRPLVIVAEEVKGEALAACIMNAIRHRETGMGMTVSVIKAPRYGEERRAILQDLATVTGATFFSRMSGKKIKEAEMTDFGVASRVESTQKFTTIIDGKGNQEDINTTIEGLKSMLKEADTNRESEQIQARISRMASGVAVINVGGATSVEMGERKDRIEDALNAVRSAQLGGVVPGGGVAILMASEAINGLEATNNDERMGFDIVRKATESPIRQMSQNAGYAADLIIAQIKNAEEPSVCDFRTGEVVPAKESGIIDPVKVTISALSNATSAATTLLMADYAIIISEK
jgi:chaperonin GroEL